MFTGIVETTAKVKRAEVRGKHIALLIEKPNGWKLANGQSVAVDGICLTVIAHTPKTFSTELMAETLLKTTGASMKAGHFANLERALVYGDRLDGHLIQGHIEGRGRITKAKRQGTSVLLSVSLPKALMRHIARHGSVAINGASLTVSNTKGNTITVALIPYTLFHTNLKTLRKGDTVNVETDFLARTPAVQKKRGRVRANATNRIRKTARR